MNAPIRLLVRPQPKLGEGPLGYLKRVAESNRLSRPAFKQINISYNAQRLKELGLLSESPSELILEPYVRELEIALVSQASIWNRRQARFCPICLQTNQFWRLEWEINFIDVCHEHHCWLVDQCSTCQKPVRWSRTRLAWCDCGALLFLECAAPCPASMSDMAATLASMLLTKERTGKIYPLVGLSLMQAQQLIRFLGAYASPNLESRPQKIANISSLAKSWPITSLVAEILDNWPHVFFRVLDRMQMASNVSNDGSQRLGRKFGYFYTYLYKGLASPAFDCIRQAFEQYITENWRGHLAKRNKRLTEQALSKATWIPLSHACHHLGVSRGRLRYLINRGSIQGEERIQQVTGRRIAVVRRDELLPLEQALNSTVTFSEARRMLGISKRRMGRLLPELFPDAARQNRGKSPWAISRADIIKILLVSKDLPELENVNEGMISLGHVIRYMSWGDQEIACLINATLNGAAPIMGVLGSAKGVTAWVYDSTAIITWRAKQKIHQKKEITIPEMAIRLGIKQEVAYFLIKRGLMSVEGRSGPRRTFQVVTEEALREFKINYIFASVLAKEIGRSPRSVIALLYEAGIKPVSGPSVDEGRQVVYELTSELKMKLAQIFSRYF